MSVVKKFLIFFYYAIYRWKYIAYDQLRSFLSTQNRIQNCILVIACPNCVMKCECVDTKCFQLVRNNVHVFVRKQKPRKRMKTYCVLVRQSLVYMKRKNFGRRAYFCFFKQNFERKKFLAYNKKFPVYIKEKNAQREKCFMLRVKGA